MRRSFQGGAVTMPPNSEGGGDPHHQAARTSTTSVRQHAGSCEVTGRDPVDVPCTRVFPQDAASQLRRRRAASHRLVRLDSGRAEPWHYEPPKHGYPSAAEHLSAVGPCAHPDLDAMREMWRAGGASRVLAARISEFWEVAT